MNNLSCACVHRRLRAQRGITLIAGLIMLMLISIMVGTAYTISTSNTKSVSNMQFRDEAISAANKGIEQIIDDVLVTGFTTLPTTQTSYTLDINNDDHADYTVSVAIPQCVQSTLVSISSGGGGSSANLGGDSFSATLTYYNTLWDITATVTDTLSGTAVEIHQGLRMPLSETQKPLVCP